MQLEFGKCNAQRGKHDISHRPSDHCPHIGRTFIYYQYKTAVLKVRLAQHHFSVVIFQSQVRDHLLTAQVAQRVLKLHGLDEEIMFGIETWSSHRRFEVKAQPFLDADSLQLRRALGEVKE